MNKFIALGVFGTGLCALGLAVALANGEFDIHEPKPVPVGVVEIGEITVIPEPDTEEVIAVTDLPLIEEPKHPGMAKPKYSEPETEGYNPFRREYRSFSREADATPIQLRKIPELVGRSHSND